MNNRDIVRALSQVARPHGQALAIGSLLLCLESAVMLLLPFVGGKIAESFLSAGAAAVSARWLLIAAFVLLTLQATLRFVTENVLGIVATRMLASLRTRLYDHLQSLPVVFFQQRKQGDLLSVVMYDVSVVSAYLSGTLTTVLTQVITLAGAMLLMWRIDPRMTALALAVVPLFYLLLKVFGRRLRPLAVAESDAYAETFAVLDENVTMMPAIKSFTREMFESDRYAQASNRLLALELKQQRIQSALGPGTQWLASLGILGVLWLAQDKVGAGTLSAGGLVAFLLYSATLTRPVSSMADFYGRTQHARAALARVMEVLNAAPEAVAGVAMPALIAPRGSIEFQHVSFAYPGREPVLTNFNLRVEGGETVAITGENGSGKSTLVHLLMRLHTPSSGSIRIDGVDISQVDLSSLRSQIALVPQFTLLFNGTVYDNIAYGRLGAAIDEVAAAAKLAQADGFIRELPQGYGTIIGDQGVRLSGGQRQRIALARALLKDAPILIFDEATAMFDPEGERDLLAACAPVLKGRTVLLITHRPASLALADRVVQMVPPPRVSHDST